MNAIAIEHRLSRRTPGTSNSSGPRRTGFTLVELIVVIAIIALLVAMLLPALKGARESARATLCSNHLRQTSTAFFAYAADHGGNFPGIYQPYRESEGRVFPYVPRFHWFSAFIGVPKVNGIEDPPTHPAQASYDYLGSYKQHSLPLVGTGQIYWTGILYCPSAIYLSSRSTVSAPLTATSFGLNPFVWRNFNGTSGYTGNASTIGAMLPLPYERLTKPSSTMLAGEVLQGQTTPPAYFQHNTQGGNINQYGEFRHKEAMNVLYFDGHATSQRTIAAHSGEVAWDGD